MLNDPYREILAALSGARVDFIIEGGVACVLQGVERVPMDHGCGSRGFDVADQSAHLSARHA